MVNVLIVDDERNIQKAFQADIISASDRYVLVDSISSAANAEMICMVKKTDMIIMDINTAGNSNGIKAAQKIKSKYPNIKIIITTSYTDARAVEFAKKAGADSFWFKDFSPIELLEVMDRTVKGENYWPDEMPNVELGDSFLSQFTTTEKIVLYNLVECVSVRKIAEKMFVEESTVKTHLKNMCNKTGCDNKTELMVLALQAKAVLPNIK